MILKLQRKLNYYKVIQKVLQSVTAFYYYKGGQLLLLSGTDSFIIMRDNTVTKWDGYYKVGQFYYKVDLNTPLTTGGGGMKLSISINYG